MPKLEIYKTNKSPNIFKENNYFQDLFIKYGNEKSFEVSKDEELDARVEFARQRNFLEQSINSLKKRVNACKEKNNSYSKIMEENMILIREINKLRLELKMVHKKYENLETTFKMNTSKSQISFKKNKTIHLHKNVINTDTTEQKTN